MTFLVVLLIGLAWAGWLWAWGRDRFMAGHGFGGSGIPQMSSIQRPPGPLATPQSAVMARRRRREVLGGLALAAVTTLVLARAWSLLWSVHLIIDLALIAYAWAVWQIERPQDDSGRPAVTLGPVLEPERPMVRPGPRP